MILQEKREEKMVNILADTENNINQLQKLVFDKYLEVAKGKGKRDEASKVVALVSKKIHEERIKLLVSPNHHKTTEKTSAPKSPGPRAKKESYKWKHHPSNPEYVWSQDLVYNGKHFLKLEKDDIILATIDNQGVNPLSPQDKAFLESRNLKFKTTDVNGL